MEENKDGKNMKKIKIKIKNKPLVLNYQRLRKVLCATKKMESNNFITKLIRAVKKTVKGILKK